MSKGQMWVVVRVESPQGRFDQTKIETAFLILNLATN